jgi:hypothetical protein
MIMHSFHPPSRVFLRDDFPIFASGAIDGAAVTICLSLLKPATMPVAS